MDRFDLQRFASAQEQTYQRALSEIRSGAKRSHWMWFVFPQIAGLGSSPMAQRYAISGIAEARAYLEHELLGPRLVEITTALGMIADLDPQVVFGPVDALKLRSSLTLFDRASGAEDNIFHTMLRRWFDGRPDPVTIERLQA